MKNDFHTQFLQSESELRTRRPVVWFISLLGPFLAGGFALFAAYIFGGEQFFMQTVGAIFATLAVFGRFIILTGYEGTLTAQSVFLTTRQLFVIVTCADLIIAAFLAYHVGLIFRIPLLGKKVGQLVQLGQELNRRNPKLKALSFVGLVLFVSFPASMTGSVGGTILGRMLGISRLRTFFAIALGAVLGNGIMFAFSDLLNQVIDKNDPFFQFGGIALMLIAIAFLNSRVSRLAKGQFPKAESIRALPEVAKKVAAASTQPSAQQAVEV